MKHAGAPNRIGGGKSLYIRILQALGISILAFALSLVLMSPFSFSATALLAAPDQNDFTINDFYNMAADGRAVRTLDPDVVIEGYAAGCPGRDCASRRN